MRDAPPIVDVWNLQNDDLESLDDRKIAFVASLLSTSTGDGG
jgi:hypothetical protein